MTRLSALDSPCKARILAVHSFRTSGSIFEQQMKRAKLDARLADLVEIVYADAPWPASGPIPADVSPYFAGPYYEWLTVNQQSDGSLSVDPEQFAKTEQYLADVIKKLGPFDGLMGFSQGALVCTALLSLQQAGLVFKNLPKFKFCVLFAGAKPSARQLAQALSQKINVPSFHIIGEADELLQQSLLLLQSYTKPLLLFHHRGHVIPNIDGYQLSSLRDFITTTTAAASTDANVMPPSKL